MIAMDDIRDPNKNPAQNPDRNSRLESLKRKLFSRNESLIKKPKDNTFTQQSFGVSDTWNEPAANGKKPMINFRAPSSLFKKFFIGAVLFLVLGVIYAFVMLYAGGNTVSTERVKISITGNAYTAGGEELPIDITVKNENSVSIDSAELIIEYPRGSNTDDASDYERKRVTLKSIAPGEEINERISVILYGEQGTTKNIRARLEYTVRGSIASREQQRTFALGSNILSAALLRHLRKKKYIQSKSILRRLCSRSSRQPKLSQTKITHSTSKPLWLRRTSVKIQLFASNIRLASSLEMHLRRLSSATMSLRCQKLKLALKI